MSGPGLVGITGVTGFIGSHLLKLAAAGGAPVRALRRATSHPGPVEGLPAEWVVGDMRRADTWDRFLPGCETVIHLAAAGVTKIDDVFDAVHVNLPALAHLLEAAARHGVRRLVLAGTCMEYGATGDRIGGRGLREDDPLAPLNAYGASKAAATKIVGVLGRDLGLEVFLLRPFYAYGPGDPANRLIPSVVRMALSGAPIRTTGGRQVRDFVHIDDVARAFLLAARVPWPGGADDRDVRVVNVGTGEGTSLSDLVLRLAALCGRRAAEVELGAVPHRRREMWRLVADCRAAGELLGWKAEIGLEEGLEDLVRRARGG